MCGRARSRSPSSRRRGRRRSPSPPPRARRRLRRRRHRSMTSRGAPLIIEVNSMAGWSGLQRVTPFSIAERVAADALAQMTRARPRADVATFAADPQEIATAFIAACEAELAGAQARQRPCLRRRPWHDHGGFPRQRRGRRRPLSARRDRASAPASPARVEATRARVGAKHQSRHRAALRAAGAGRCDRASADLRRETGRVLAGPRHQRRRAAFRAIARAAGGLGACAAAGRRMRRRKRLFSKRCALAPPTATASRWQYANGFADLFDLGLPTSVRRARDARCGAGTRRRSMRPFSPLFRISHIVRKHGAPCARGGPRRARPFSKTAPGAATGAALDPALAGLRRGR